MKTEEINIRDPFVFPYEGTYYMTGTRAATCWGKADGFDGYYSKDLVDWKGPVEIFHRPAGFWADKNYWAPEIHFYKDKFYLFATFNSQAEDKKGTMILASDRPLGPYELHSHGKITPKDWQCLDGTFYLSKNGTPYMVFSHEWVDIGDGQICAVKLNEDLTERAGEPFTLFSASMAEPWVRSIQNHQWDGPVYVTDGPFLYRKNERELLLFWATFSEHGYAEGLARSDTGEIDGKWTVDPRPFFSEDGGHGMLFRTFEGDLKMVLHRPNEHLKEHPVFLDVKL